MEQLRKEIQHRLVHIWNEGAIHKNCDCEEEIVQEDRFDIQGLIELIDELVKLKQESFLPVQQES